jgi:acyl carrier protein
VPRVLPFSLVNHYGPTEYSVVTTWAPVVTGTAAGAAPPPIGRPIANTQLYVLDRHLQPVPIGVPGELYITGAGLARGYLHQPALTAERFIEAPAALAPGARLYRTGDMVRYRSDGHLEFLGRCDAQVKLRGLRMELGEIEAVLRHHPQVREAVVVVQEAVPGDKRLVAFVVEQPTATSERPSPQRLQTVPPGHLTTALRDWLRQQLPEYMVPSAFVLLEALPLTPNGKVDRHALPYPQQLRPELDSTFVAPHTSVEQALAAIWAEVLGLEQIGIHDNFFALGGHSLLATCVITRVRERFQVELPVHILFEEPTIAHLAGAIEQAQQHSQTISRIHARPRGDKTVGQFLTELDHLSESEVKAMPHEMERSARR